MKHLVINTHYGSNVELFLNLIKQDNRFHLFLTEDRESFISTYESDTNVQAPINPEIYSEGNWSLFSKNAFSYLNDSYGPQFNKWLVQVVYGEWEDVNTKSSTKHVIFIRDPHMSWAYKNTRMDLKNFINTCKKALSDSVNDSRFFHRIRYEELIENDYTFNIVKTVFSDHVNFPVSMNKNFESYNKYVNQFEHRYKSSYPFRKFSYNWDFSTEEQTWNLISNRLEREMTILGYNELTLNNFDSYR